MGLTQIHSCEHDVLHSSALRVDVASALAYCPGGQGQRSEALGQQLVTISEELELRAQAIDVDGFHAELCRLRNVLVSHLHLDPITRRCCHDAVEALKLGRRELIGLVDDLLAGEWDQTDPCRCIEGGPGLASALIDHARLEAYTGCG